MRTRLFLVSVVIGFVLGWLTGEAFGQTHDQVGHAYPIECQGDLSWVKADIVRVPQNDPYLQMLAPFNRPNLARVNLSTNPPRIVVSDRLSGWKYDDALRHELCHVVAGNWHK